MPLTSAGVSATIAANLAAVGMTGSEVSRYATAIAVGVSNWASTIQVVTTDIGTTGVGKNVPTPVVVASPVILSNLTIGFSSQGLGGSSVPQLCLGLSNGLSLAFAQGFVTTTHPTVGVGSGVAKFVYTTSVPFLVEGFAQIGMSGTSSVNMATAIGIALDTTFASLVLPVVIVGPSSIYAGVGVGTGNIV